MSIAQLRQFKIGLHNRPVINTMQVQSKIAEKPRTVAEKAKIIEQPIKKDNRVSSIDQIIRDKPKKGPVRDFFKERVLLLNNELEDNF